MRGPGTAAGRLACPGRGLLAVIVVRLGTHRAVRVWSATAYGPRPACVPRHYLLGTLAGAAPSAVTLGPASGRPPSTRPGIGPADRAAGRCWAWWFTAGAALWWAGLDAPRAGILRILRPEEGGRAARPARRPAAAGFFSATPNGRRPSPRGSTGRGLELGEAGLGPGRGVPGCRPCPLAAARVPAVHDQLVDETHHHQLSCPVPGPNGGRERAVEHVARDECPGHPVHRVAERPEGGSRAEVVGGSVGPPRRPRPRLANSRLPVTRWLMRARTSHCFAWRSGRPAGSGP